MKKKALSITVHGKILDQLGYQAYQGSTESIAELVANAWDADATKVNIQLPDSTSGQITVIDNGDGMTLRECESAYLNIGYDKRRGRPVARTRKGRLIMGRKGIGKFAGFGIAEVIEIETISAETGQRTVFSMDVDKLRTDEYVSERGKIAAEYTNPDDGMKEKHGTKVVLKRLRISKNISKKRFPRSLARRFLVHHTVEDFEILVNGNPIPQSMDVSAVEFSFPKDYPDGRRPDGLDVNGEWGVERVGGKEIRWRAGFAKDPISDKDRQGMAVFANGKLAQQAFFFHLTGALPGQHGQGYMFGQVIADFLEEFNVDVMSIDRQRVKWDVDYTAPLLEWGRSRTTDLLRLWGELKGKQKYDGLKEKVHDFDERMSKLQPHERKTAEKVLRKLAGTVLTENKNYEDLAGSILTAFENGRLQELWAAIAGKEYTSDAELINLLVETDVVSALNVAEGIKAKITALVELQGMVDHGRLEKDLRNHISRHPWIIAPKWDTYKRETRADSIIKRAADESKISDESYAGRVDLVLVSGDHLLVLEFMRPGLSLDFDHLNRCERYVLMIKDAINNTMGEEFKHVTGYIVAERISKSSGMSGKIEMLRNSNIFVKDWQSLISSAKSEWEEYLKILAGRGDDPRLTKLMETSAS